MILEKTRAWTDAESMTDSARLSARLNLYRFLDLAESWSPLESPSTVEAFLDYLDAIAEEPSEEVDAAGLSGEDAVTLLTVHKAKGLEWPVVFIPAVYANNFPLPGGRRVRQPVPETRRSPLALAHRPAPPTDPSPPAWTPGDPPRRSCGTPPTRCGPPTAPRSGG